VPLVPGRASPQRAEPRPGQHPNNVLGFYS
jgi:hypothetical protein